MVMLRLAVNLTTLFLGPSLESNLSALIGLSILVVGRQVGIFFFLLTNWIEWERFYKYDKEGNDTYSSSFPFRYLLQYILSILKGNAEEAENWIQKH